MRHQFEYSPTSQRKNHFTSASHLPQQSAFGKTKSSDLKSLKERINKLLDSDKKSLGLLKRQQWKHLCDGGEAEIGEHSNDEKDQDHERQVSYDVQNSRLRNGTLQLYVGNGSKTIQLSLSGLSGKQAKSLIYKFNMHKLVIETGKLA